jgi:peptidoglycan/LPS O-acetylase OafA/YrhL
MSDGNPSGKAEHSRIASLDGLRAGSIALVVLGHLAATRYFPLRSPYLAAHYADAAVRAFFVISGFLITTLLLREQQESGTIRLKEFYVRRAYRILPAAYFFMIVVSAVFHAALSPKDLAIAFTYLTSYSVHRPWILGHLWSLSVEEQFYFLWPLVMRKGARTATQVAIVVMVIAPAVRLILAASGYAQGNGSYFPLVSDAIATGCLLALLQPVVKKHAAFFAWRGFPLIWILTLLIPVFFRTHYTAYETVGSPVLHVGLALCMQNAITARYRVLNARLPVWIGALSYSLYLWQEPFLNRYSSRWYTAFPANLVLAFLAAGISYYCIERPALRWRLSRDKSVERK